MYDSRIYAGQKLKNSQILYIERYQSLEKLYEYRDPPEIELKVIINLMSYKMNDDLVASIKIMGREDFL